MSDNPDPLGGGEDDTSDLCGGAYEVQKDLKLRLPWKNRERKKRDGDKIESAASQGITAQHMKTLSVRETEELAPADKQAVSGVRHHVAVLSTSSPERAALQNLPTESRTTCLPSTSVPNTKQSLHTVRCRKVALRLPNSEQMTSTTPCLVSDPVKTSVPVTEESEALSTSPLKPAVVQNTSVGTCLPSDHVPDVTVIGQTFYTGVAASAMDDDEYNMNHTHRGKAIIFNHFKFKDPIKHKDRVGTDVDVKKLTSTLTWLGFEVIVYHDLRLNEIFTKLHKVSKESHAENDCLLVVVMTHGGENNELLAHDVGYKAETLWRFFLADNCIELAGKPKMFFIQACKGALEEKVVKLRPPRTTVDGTSMSGRNVSYTIPCNADFLIAYSSVEGYASYRDNGSWFIQSLCDQLRARAEHMDVLKILTRTARHVATKYQTPAEKPSMLITADPISGNLQMYECHTQQMPAHYSTLTRELYLRPKDRFPQLVG